MKSSRRSRCAPSASRAPSPDVREQELFRRLNRHLGAATVPSWIEHVVLGDLGDRTVREAMDAGVGSKDIWLAVWRFLELPESER